MNHETRLAALVGVGIALAVFTLAIIISDPSILSTPCNVADCY